ncbi:MAG: hypothetical protein A3F74_22000 [Betaproteobacteria bacterium RIFCSPLOWO2_12_FULL_62_58]|nr:MAG: hypothetical protein A3F74_22000 [Betaproteobacteria bacterium RIFCSPLOWO2_12_FULL_62_58]
MSARSGNSSPSSGGLPQPEQLESGWFGLIAPAAIPRDVIAKLLRDELPKRGKVAKISGAKVD